MELIIKHYLSFSSSNSSQELKGDVPMQPIEGHQDKEFVGTNHIDAAYSSDENATLAAHDISTTLSNLSMEIIDRNSQQLSYQNQCHVDEVHDQNMQETDNQNLVEGVPEEPLNSSSSSAAPISRKKRQSKRNTGKSYRTQKFKRVSRRTCTKLPICRTKCSLSVSREDQLNNFNSYWAQGSYVERKKFMKALISVHPKKRFRGIQVKLRKCTAAYHVFTNSGKVKVCRNCFRLTFGESQGFLGNMVKQLWQDERLTEVESRGKTAPPNKTIDIKLDGVRRHIAQFPAYQSHYARAHTSMKYLASNLTVPKMYKLYTDDVKDPVSLYIYRREFNATGLKFKPPQLDTCHKCDTFAAKRKFETDENTKNMIKEQQIAHHEAADQAYKQKARDKNEAKKSNGSAIVCSFDLQQCLPTPALQTSVTFYKRALWTFNLTINNNTSGKTKCYMWHEGIAKRGANEISSCLYNYVNNLDSKVKHVTFYSDSCAGQNKNKILSGMMSVIVANHPTLETIDHKFLESGHTHMECDSDHALIERAKKRESSDIHCPEDWYELVRNAKPNNPFEVIEINQKCIYNFEDLYKGGLITRKKDANNEKFLMQQVRWLRFINEQGIVYFKKSLSEEEPFSKLDLRRRGNFNISDDYFKQCYNGMLRITREKKQDLVSLLPLLRPEVHYFYNSLPAYKSQSNINLDPDLHSAEQFDSDPERLDHLVQNDTEIPTKRRKLDETKPSDTRQRRSTRFSSKAKPNYIDE